VFAIVPTFDRTLGKLGISTDGVGTTSLAGAMQLDRPLGDNVKKILQLSVEHEYAQFVDHVAQSRNKPFDEIDNIAQGRVWAAPQALDRGLVDNLGLLQDAVNAAAQRAKLGNDYQIDYIEANLSWRQELAQQISTYASRIAKSLAPDMSLMRVMPERLTSVQKEMNRLSRYASKPQAVYYCGCEVE
jgi:protease-4